MSDTVINQSNHLHYHTINIITSHLIIISTTFTISSSVLLLPYHHYLHYLFHFCLQLYSHHKFFYSNHQYHSYYLIHQPYLPYLLPHTSLTLLVTFIIHPSYHHLLTPVYHSITHLTSLTFTNQYSYHFQSTTLTARDTYHFQHQIRLPLLKMSMGNNPDLPTRGSNLNNNENENEIDKKAEKSRKDTERKAAK